MSAKIMMIIAFSYVFITALALERVPDKLADFVGGLGLDATTFMLLTALLILLAGSFIDVSPAILLLTPVLLPVAPDLGVSGVHFGVVLISGLAVGNCTPPVGNCLNVCAAICRMPIGRIFLGAAPFLVANVMVLALLCIFPELVLWIPDAVMGPQRRKAPGHWGVFRTRSIPRCGDVRNPRLHETREYPHEQRKDV